MPAFEYTHPVGMSDQHTVDFLQKKYDVQSERAVRARVSKTGRVLGATLAVAAMIGTFFSYRIAQVTHGDEGDIGALSLFSTFSSSLSRLVTSNDKTLVGEADDRVNFLLLGIGGAGHDGPQLTDTIILGSFKPSTKQLGMLSIPRDLYVNIPGYGYSKLNHANAYGEQKGDGRGLATATDVVEDVVGEDIAYTIRVDFSGFEKIIDELGGVDVYVDRTFSDSSYPLDDGLGSVETVTFAQGWQHMDGETALKFARSRKGTNGEGSDFARAARQQKIIVAAKKRATSAGVLLNPARLTRLLNTLDDHIDTNLSFWEMMKLAKYAPDVSPEAITMQVLDTSSGILYSAMYEGAGYVVVPWEEDWSDVHNVADAMFATTSAAASEPTPAQPEQQTLARVEIQNGTSIVGLASDTAQRLQGSAFEVVALGNAASKHVARTVIYDLTDGRKSSELSSLKEFLGADVVMSSEGWIYSEDVVPSELTVDGTPDAELVTSDESVDFLIIVGEDAASLVLR